MSTVDSSRNATWVHALLALPWAAVTLIVAITAYADTVERPIMLLTPIAPLLTAAGILLLRRGWLIVAALAGTAASFIAVAGIAIVFINVSVAQLRVEALADALPILWLVGAAASLAAMWLGWVERRRSGSVAVG